MDKIIKPNDLESLQAYCMPNVAEFAIDKAELELNKAEMKWDERE